MPMAVCTGYSTHLQYGNDSVHRVLNTPAVLLGTHVSIHHSRDDNPVVADVLAKRAPFFKVELILQLRYIDVNNN